MASAQQAPPREETESTEHRAANDPGDLIAGAEQLVREIVRTHPTACLVGSALLGFAAARLLRQGDGR